MLRNTNYMETFVHYYYDCALDKGRMITSILLLRIMQQIQYNL